MSIRPAVSVRVVLFALASASLAATISIVLVLTSAGLVSASERNLGVPLVEFAVPAQSAPESGGALTVSVVLSEIHTDDVTVPFTLSGTATDQGDFTIDASPLVIPAGSLSADIGVTLTGDVLDELDETIILTLGAPTNATLGSVTEHTLTILDDDLEPTVEFRFRRAQVQENAGVVPVLVVLDAVSGRDVSVPFLHSGSAQHPADYAIDASPLAIPAGQTSAAIQVRPVNDAVDEPWERIQIDLDAGIVGATPGPKDSFVLLVIDDDGVNSGPAVQGLRPDATALSFANQRVGETQAAQTVTLTNTQSTSINLTGAVVEGLDPDDFQLVLPGNLPLLLDPGDSASVDVSFAPLFEGVRRADLRIVQSPSGVPETHVQLEGLAYGPTGAEVRVNAGPLPYMDEQLRQWSADHDFAGGGYISWPGPIAGTNDDTLYQVARFGPSFQYGFALPDGTYELRLLMAELVMTQPGWRIFDVSAEGALVLDDLDLFAASGTRQAWQSPAFRIELQDGTLDLDFVASVGDALVSAIEIRSVPVLTALEPELDFGAVDPGGSVELALSLVNSGLHEGRVTSVTFEIGAQSMGSGEDFSVEIDGVRYHGGSSTVSHTVDLELPPDTTTLLPVFFEPTVHASHGLTLRLEGDFAEMLEATLIATGAAGPGWGYLHPVLANEPDPVVDYDGDGSEDVLLVGSGSHTHEPGRSIASWEWAQGGQVFATGADVIWPLAAGASIVELTITDDGQPPSSASDSLQVTVHTVDAVPGVLASYYEDTGTGTLFLLDNVPSSADFVEQIEDLALAAQGGLVGGSPFDGGVMVRMRANFEVTQVQDFHFVPAGGVGSRVEVDGAPHTLAEPFPIGTHALEARFAVDDLGDLPVLLSVFVGGQPAPGFAASLTHDLSIEPPLIHDMPGTGSEAGGIPIAIEGFALFPRDAVTVHWGRIDLDAADFTSWAPTELRFLSPPGTGSIQVSVETPAGTSPPRTYTYMPSGPVPPAWIALANVGVNDPTTGTFGPDGRLYVGQLSGHVTAITFDEDYNAVQVQQYAGVSGLTNRWVCGLTFDPYDDPLAPVRIYVGHGEQWHNGGGSFSGPSPFTGQVSVLTGPDFDAPQAVITQLPTSNHDHSVNGLVFDANGDLLICMGGNTNAGVRWPTIGDVPESPLSGAILKAALSRPSFNGQIEYVHSTTGQPVDDQVLGNEIDVVPGVDVFVHAPGFRNTFDLLLTTKGLLYATDNGANNGFGPSSTGPDTQGPHPHVPDELFVERGDYYGHPNRGRGRHDARQNFFKDPWVASEPEDFVQCLEILDASTNGICEYRATCFNSAIRGQLVVQRWNGLPTLIELEPDGRHVTSTTTIQMPPLRGLDVTTGPGGALLALNYSIDRVEVIVPDDAAAAGLVAYDITPWRAPAGGGQRFVIGGEGFGTLQSTEVRIGGVPAPLTAVSARRIVGLVPPSALGATGLLDVEIQVGVDGAVIPAAFRYMEPAPGLERGTWRAAADLPLPLGPVASAIQGDTLYVFAGGSPATYAYDLHAGTWSSPLAPPMLVGDSNACAAHGGELYLFGGTASASGKVQIYDPASDTWSLGADMPWAGAACSAVAFGARIHVMGGIVGAGAVPAHAVYDPGTDTWDPSGPSSPLPTAVADAALATDGARLYLFGGRAAAAPGPVLDVVQVYDPATDTWDASDQPGSLLQPMPLARAGAGRAVHYFGELFVIGGASDTVVFDDVHAYDPETNTWRADTPLPTARHGIAPVRFQSRVFVAGGDAAPGSSPSAALEVFTDQ